MNTFKLLSSSTSLARRLQRHDSPHHGPSNGPSRNPQLFDASQTGQHDRPAKKRKLTGESSPATAERNIDFFSDGAKSANGVAEVKPTSEFSISSKTLQAAHADSITSPVPQLDEEECKKILKQHKLRITTLFSPRAKKQKRKSSRTEDAHKKKVEVYPQPLQSYSQLRPRYDVSSRLTANLEQQGYQTPTEVQMAALPLLLDQDEEVDVLSIAPTGSGKTLAFLIPLIHRTIQAKQKLAKEDKELKGTQAVILAPTKELARQTVNEARKLIDKTGVKVTLVKKGMKVASEETAIDDEDNAQKLAEEEEDDDGTNAAKDAMFVKSHILVSTPGVFVNAISRQKEDEPARLNIRYLVLDEADVLLDPLFRDQTFQIWNTCHNPSLRVSLWSATMGASIESLAQSTILERYDKSNIAPSSQANFLRLVVGLKDSALPSIHHKLTYCATESGKLLALRQLLRPSTTDDGPILRPPFLVFTQTIPRAIALHSEMKYDIPVAAGGSSRIAVLHAELSDTARDNIMARFRRGEIWVLITTDLLSRGVDFKGVNGVVNYDFPGSSAAYIHRVGRTGRAGREGGVAVTLYAKEDVSVLGIVVNVIAASEKQRAVIQSCDNDSSEQQSEGMDKWLVDLLPKVSKRDRQQLKKGGIESRKRGSKVSRISTKSGYQRKLEHRKKERQESRPSKGRDGDAGDGESDGFEGFDD